MATIAATHNLAADAYRAMLGVEKYLAQCSIEPAIRELVKLHVSQINGCAYCIDMHWKDARAGDETEQRLYSLPAWRETPFYSQRERTALLLAEQLTKVAHHPLSEEVLEQAKAEFSDQELLDLAWVVAAINAWNRVNIAVSMEPGGYQAAKQALSA